MTSRGVEWLSAAADDPEKCRAVWTEDPCRPCMLPTGRLFDVVVVNERLGLETFDQLLRRVAPFGPALVDHKARCVGFFLSSDSQKSFTHYLGRETQTPPCYRYLNTKSVVVVPGPMPMAGYRYQWLRAPTRRPQANPPGRETDRCHRRVNPGGRHGDSGSCPHLLRLRRGSPR
ncbi:bifunctional DNA primase/polymerase [Streptomyces sp. NPDC058371]|uniref:bifunctional DNA primase/polymerase n=1 Tax=Streptomyces sp. NPDC058371 TaxID=3346463 RepID=UPI0036535306